VAVGADAARLHGPAKAAYSRAFTGHLQRLAAALRLSDDPAENLEQVTQLMSGLVGALLFARAIDDPAQSDAVLHAMRRRLKAQFGRESARAATVSFFPSHDLLRGY